MNAKSPLQKNWEMGGNFQMSDMPDFDLFSPEDSEMAVSAGPKKPWLAISIMTC